MSSILRFIIVKTSPDRSADVERMWNEDCGPLMRKRPGSAGSARQQVE